MAKARKKTRKWEIERVHKNVHTLRFHTPSCRMLLVSDVHWDNPHCDRSLLKQHFDEALRIDAPIMSVGDWFCAMQGKYDRRSDKSCVRPEHQTGDYLDALVSTCATWLEPYKDNLILLCKGNHETKIKEKHETNLLDRLAAKLRDRGGITQQGGYAGWLKLEPFLSGSARQPLTLWYHHGFGGGGPVTQGKIDFNRYGTYVDADIIVAGHVHYKEAFPTCRAYLTRYGTPSVREMWCCRLGTYKDEFANSDDGFHIERGGGPRPQGGYWLDLKAKQRKRKGKSEHYTLAHFIPTER